MVIAEEMPPDDGTIRGAGVKRRRFFNDGDGGDKVRRWTLRPYADDGSALHRHYSDQAESICYQS